MILILILASAPHNRRDRRGARARAPAPEGARAGLRQQQQLGAARDSVQAERET